MGVHSFLKVVSVAALAVGGSHAARIIQANDDGWAELYLRSFHYALIDAGHDAVVSAPAENESARSTWSPSPPKKKPQTNKQTKEAKAPELLARAPSLKYLPP